MKLISLVCFAVVSCTFGSASADQVRLALVIGNEDYPNEVGRLTNPHEDADAIANALTSVGFQTTIGKDLNEDEFIELLGEFESRLIFESSNGSEVTAFLYYSGHGASASIRGRRQNFLIPAKETVTNVPQLVRHGIPLEETIDALSLTGATSIFVVTDACRNDLVSAFDKSGNKGFVSQATRSGMFVAHATYPGSTAPDDGLFAITLAKYLQQTGLEAARVFQLTNREVARYRGLSEIPTTANALLGDICFVSCEGGNDVVGAQTIQKPSIRNITGRDHFVRVFEYFNNPVRTISDFDRIMPEFENASLKTYDKFYLAEINKPYDEGTASESTGLFRFSFDKQTGEIYSSQLTLIPKNEAMIRSIEAEVLDNFEISRTDYDAIVQPGFASKPFELDHLGTPISIRNVGSQLWISGTFEASNGRDDFDPVLLDDGKKGLEQHFSSLAQFADSSRSEYSEYAGVYSNYCGRNFASPNGIVDMRNSQWVIWFAGNVPYWQSWVTGSPDYGKPGYDLKVSDVGFTDSNPTRQFQAKQFSYRSDNPEGESVLSQIAFFREPSANNIMSAVVLDERGRSIGPQYFRCTEPITFPYGVKFDHFDLMAIPSNGQTCDQYYTDDLIAQLNEGVERQYWSTRESICKNAPD